MASGQQHTVKEFVEETANQLNMKLKWKGRGLKEKILYGKNCVIEIIKRYLDL